MRRHKTGAFIETAAVTATAVALGGSVADALQPLVESTNCSDVGNNLCPAESEPKNDLKDAELQRAVAEPNRIESPIVHRGVARILERPDVAVATGYTSPSTAA